jgi:hypothetical protein
LEAEVGLNFTGFGNVEDHDDSRLIKFSFENCGDSDKDIGVLEDLRDRAWNACKGPDLSSGRRRGSS